MHTMSAMASSGFDLAPETASVSALHQFGVSRSGSNDQADVTTAERERAKRFVDMEKLWVLGGG